ncbi:hypothetical protein BU23DRAFT_551417, partial [Bimuria novae-zelandiae CBS 107.79]
VAWECRGLPLCRGLCESAGPTSPPDRLHEHSQERSHPNINAMAHLNKQCSRGPTSQQTAAAAALGGPQLRYTAT